MFNRCNILFVITLFCLITAPLMAGGEHEIEKVEELIHVFNRNMVEQNVEEIGKGLHPTFQIAVSSQNRIELFSRSAFLEKLETKEMGGKPAEVKLKNMDISGSVGTVTVLLVSKTEWTRAYYNLLRTESGWVVFNLVMERRPNPETQG